MAERVLVTGARSAAALDLARDFRAAGFEVHVADCSPARIARWSRAPHAFHRYASPRRDPVTFSRDVSALVAGLDPRLVVPTCEEVFHLARPSLAQAMAGRLFAPSHSDLAVLHAKDRFAALAADLGLPVPETRPVTCRADATALGPDASVWVLKPVWSRFGTRALVSPAAASLASLPASPAEPWVAQRRVHGTEASSYAVARDGRLVAFAAYGSDWRMPGGASLGLSAIHGKVAEALRDMSVTLAGALGLTGQFAFDAVVDAAGTPWLIECNPRSTSGLHLLASTGALARAMAGGPPCRVHGAVRGRHVLPAMLTYGLAGALRRGEPGRWLSALREGRDVVGARGDRWPVPGALVDGIGFAIRGCLDGTGAASASTVDIEWNGETLA